MNSFLLMFVVVVGAVIVFDLYEKNANGKEVTSKQHTQTTFQLPTVSFDNQTLGRNYSAVAKHDGTIALTKKMPNETSLLSLKKHSETIHRLAFSADGQWLLSSDAGGTSKLWTTRKGQLIVELRHLEKELLRLQSAIFKDVDINCTCLIFELQDGSLFFYDYNADEVKVNRFAIRSNAFSGNLSAIF